ncbi:nuclear transport factor 2 family protein [Pseudomonas syringae]|uniref:nuclear transport factor 2 family protein n=1 Tax=Pseudomonas syringae TaxID=317 RepID=UPI00200B4D68|nr:nuclear transport factor 2 family protein [Pseudomonas syringae]MCK9740481.1 nuclear transport factor 2 family protein [Pseudomonas syringae pv. syringae]MCK9768584.1 nuclear transport factor 2 family protein [Pseudomonas syringae pv. syringae]
MLKIDSTNPHSVETALPDASAKNGVLEWHRIVAESDWESLAGLLDEDVVFHNPSSFEPHLGRGPMQVILPTVFSVLEKFEYHRHFGSKSGYVLEFSAEVGGEKVTGVDVIEFNDEGKITDFVVIMRPAGVALTLSHEVGKKIAAAQSSAQ